MGEIMGEKNPTMDSLMQKSTVRGHIFKAVISNDRATIAKRINILSKESSMGRIGKNTVSEIGTDTREAWEKRC